MPTVKGERKETLQAPLTLQQACVPIFPLKQISDLHPNSYKIQSKSHCFCAQYLVCVLTKTTDLFAPVDSTAQSKEDKKNCQKLLQSLFAIG